VKESLAYCSLCVDIYRTGVELQCPNEANVPVLSTVSERGFLDHSNPNSFLRPSRNCSPMTSHLQERKALSQSVIRGQQLVAEYADNGARRSRLRGLIWVNENSLKLNWRKLTSTDKPILNCATVLRPRSVRSERLLVLALWAGFVAELRCTMPHCLTSPPSAESSSSSGAPNFYL
jgi:hypothetical protein